MEYSNPGKLIDDPGSVELCKLYEDQDNILTYPYILPLCLWLRIFEILLVPCSFELTQACKYWIFGPARYLCVFCIHALLGKSTEFSCNMGSKKFACQKSIMMLFSNSSNRADGDGLGDQLTNSSARFGLQNNGCLHRKTATMMSLGQAHMVFSLHFA